MAKRATLLSAAGAIAGTEIFPIAQLSTTVIKTGTTLSASSTDNSYNDSANGFVSAGFVAGMSVNVIGFTGNAANNIHSGVIQSVTAGKMIIASPEGDLLVTDSAGETVTITAWTTKRLALPLALKQVITLRVPDETVALAAGAGQITLRCPFPFKVLAVRASLTTAQMANGGGGIFTVDVNEAGSSILGTKITIDNTEKTSVTAATPCTITDSVIADDAEITVDIDQIGDGTAKGLVVQLIGYVTG